MSLVDRLKKASTSKYANYLGKVKLPDYHASCPAIALNIALQGKIDGAITPGHHIIAGDSRHFKTSMALVLAAGWLDKYPESALLFIDTEFGASVEYFQSCGVDASRVLHVPVMDVEEMKFEINKQLNSLQKDDKLFIIIDSVGGSASRKEVEDANKGHSAQDMGLRAKALNSMWRVITPRLKMTGTPLVSINHIYDGDHHAKIIAGGRKTLLSADNAWIIGRQKLKEGDTASEVTGHNFIINVEKSRKIREKSKIPVYVTFEGGIETHRPLVDLAAVLGWMISPARGWRCFIDPETGEVIGKNFREKEAYQPDFWNDLLANEKFRRAIEMRYQLESNDLMNAAEQEMMEHQELLEAPDEQT